MSLRFWWHWLWCGIPRQMRCFGNNWWCFKCAKGFK